MKISKILLGSVVLLCLSLGVSAYANCPSTAEFQQKNNYFQTQSISIISGSLKDDPDAMLKAAQDLSNEQDNYNNSLAPGCVAYFNSTQNPDCQRLSVLVTGYLIMDKEKQTPAFKSQVINALNKAATYCPYQVQAVKPMIK